MHCLDDDIIQVPLLFAAASEGGANVFEVTYFKGKDTAWLLSA